MAKNEASKEPTGGSSRPNDLPIKEQEYALPNSTFGSRTSASKKVVKPKDVDSK